MLGRRPEKQGGKRRKRKWEQDEESDSSNSEEVRVSAEDLKRWREEEDEEDRRQELERRNREAEEASRQARVREALKALPSGETREDKPLVDAVREIERLMEERQQQGTMAPREELNGHAIQESTANSPARPSPNPTLSAMLRF